MSDFPHLAYIGLGSNLQSPRDQVTSALDELARLPACQLIKASSLYRSAPLGPAQPDYINAVAALGTELEPLALLRQLQALEQQHGRLRLERWGPRTLDLDLLLYDDVEMATEVLTLPHPEMVNRNFVLIPLAEIAPDLQMADNRPLTAWVADCSHDGLERID